MPKLLFTSGEYLIKVTLPKKIPDHIETVTDEKISALFDIEVYKNLKKFEPAELKKIASLTYFLSWSYKLRCILEKREYREEYDNPDDTLKGFDKFKTIVTGGFYYLGERMKK